MILPRTTYKIYEIIKGEILRKLRQMVAPKQIRPFLLCVQVFAKREVVKISSGAKINSEILFNLIKSISIDLS